MIEPLRFPSSRSAQLKANALAESANLFETLRGDEQFINVRKGSGGVLISLNWGQILARIPKQPPFSLHEYKVASLPAAVSGVVPPYVIANTYSNTSTGTANVSVGVVIAHSVGDVFLAAPIQSIMNSGSPLMDASNKSIGMIEFGTYGTYFTCSLTQNGGSQGSAGSLCTYTYDMYERTGTTKLASMLSVEKSRAVATTVTTPASGGMVKGVGYLSNAGAWVVREADEIFGEVSC
jgi:hypothetical protein